MKIYLYEYNVTPDLNNEDQLSIKIENDTITYNDEVINNMEIINEISCLLDNFKDLILNLKDIKCSSYKGGRQEQLQIYSENICNDEITFIGNTDNQEVADFYNKFKMSLLDIINN